MTAHEDLPPEPFRGLESELETIIVDNPSLLGKPLLIIGRQVNTGTNGRLDLLAMDALGTVYVIELKTARAGDTAVAQVYDYLTWAKVQTREELIKTARLYGGLRDLEAAFRAFFGEALPDGVNASQVGVVIAASFEPRALRNLAAMRKTFGDAGGRRHEQLDAQFRLAPASENKDGPFSPWVPLPHSDEQRQAWTAPVGRPFGRTPIHETVRRYWMQESGAFPGPFLPFRLAEFRYAAFCQREGIEPISNSGQLGRQLAFLVARTPGWTAESLDMTPFRPRFAPFEADHPGLHFHDDQRKVCGYRRSGSE
jgi:hypothetical protein